MKLIFCYSAYLIASLNLQERKFKKRFAVHCSCLNFYVWWSSIWW